MKLKLFGKGFNYSQDGPGNRLVYHLAGCNMHCPWCSNPEGMSANSPKAFDISNQEIINEVLSAVPMFFDGGGVTFTGGESSLQFEALLPVFKRLYENNISIAIETNGTSKNLSRLFNYIDFLIIDFKHPNSKKLKEITGVGNEIIKENILLAEKLGIDMLIRIPFINGFNTSPEDIEGFLDFFSQIKSNSVKFEVLKYHEYGKDKWLHLGLDYKMENAFVTDDQKNNFEEKLKNIGLKVIRT